MARRLTWIALAALLVAGITALVFLIRAGDPGATNWPIHFELRSSDNGVLFQFAQDVFAGRPLDWSFSPQVFVFPEIPISLLGYLLAGGTVQLYYLMVACINVVLLFLGLFAVIRYLYATETLPRRLLRAGLCVFPLVFLPLFGTTWLFEYQLAPTYYYGMYLMILVAPIMFFGCARWVRIALGIGIALTAASNPLALVFTIPALVCVLVVRMIAGGLRSVVRPALWSAASILLAFLIRILFFGPLQGTSPLTYVSTSLFQGRIVSLEYYIRGMAGNWTTAIVLYLGTGLLVAGFVIAIIIAVKVIRGTQPNRAKQAAWMYYALVPITGLAGTAVLLITEYLYLWPILILPIVLAFLPLPRKLVPFFAGAAVIALVVVGSITGGAANLARVPTYFAYRSPETQCLDSKLPAGMTVGYSTFSDARRIELTSDRHILLIQLKSNGVRAYWLTNRDYARDNVGEFFYINANGDEPPISVSFLEKNFGAPDSSFSCAPGEKVLIYTTPSKLAKIKARYSTLPPPGESLGELSGVGKDRSRD